MIKCDFCPYSRMIEGKLQCPYKVCMLGKDDIAEILKNLKPQKEDVKTRIKMKRLFKTIAATLAALVVAIFVSTLVTLIRVFCFPLFVAIGVIAVVVVGYIIFKETK